MSSLAPSSIYCMSKDCMPSSDWLTHMPSSAAGWAVGGVILGLSSIRIKRVDGLTTKGCFLIGTLNLLAVSLFLRAAMNLKRGDKMALYKASLFFNYYVAVGLSSGLGMPILKFTRHYKSILTTSALTSLVHFSLTILMIPAVIVMFNAVNGNGVDPSVYIIRTVVFCIMILRFISLIAEMLAMCVQASYIPKSDVLASMLQNALLLMWAIFMASRTFLPLDNLARDSEAMFYGLNIVPLFVIGLIPRSTVVIPDLPAMRGIV